MNRFEEVYLRSLFPLVKLKFPPSYSKKKTRETLKKPNYKSRASSDNNKKKKKKTLIIYYEPWISVNDVIYNLNRKFYG